MQSRILTLMVSLMLFQSAGFANDTLPVPASEIPLYAISLIGTPYKYGGKSPDTGMDCSGFVGHVFKQTTGTQLPTSARQISQHGQALQSGELQPGDLVFFNTLNRAFSHVGIYLGENRFVHSTSSATAKVMISNMGDNYWSKRFDGARRLIDPTDNPATAP